MIDLAVTQYSVIRVCQPPPQAIANTPRSWRGLLRSDRIVRYNRKSRHRAHDCCVACMMLKDSDVGSDGWPIHCLISTDHRFPQSLLALLKFARPLGSADAFAGLTSLTCFAQVQRRILQCGDVVRHMGIFSNPELATSNRECGRQIRIPKWRTANRGLATSEAADLAKQ